MSLEVRSLHERAADTRLLIATDNQAWVASASIDGDAYLIPLTYRWDGHRFTFSTVTRSRTVRNLARSGVTRISLPSTNDVVIIDGRVELVPSQQQREAAVEYAASAGWDPSKSMDTYTMFYVVPIRIQAWRNEAEITGRDVMREGVWLDHVIKPSSQ